MKTRPEWARMFTKNGRFLEAGDTIYRPALAQTLRTVAEKGVDAFYLVSLGRISHMNLDTHTRMNTIWFAGPHRSVNRENSSSQWRYPDHGRHEKL